MAYVKNTWNCGDVISAQKLNNIEDGIEEALECCGSGGDAGYSCEDGWEELYSYTFPQDTHQSHGSGGYYSTASEQMLLPNRIKVEVNSEEYILDGTVGASETFYGAPTTGGVYADNYTFDFSEYPFSIENVTDSEIGYAINFYTQANDPCIVTISEAAEIVTTTECFEKARGYSCKDGWQEIWSYDFNSLYHYTSHGDDYYYGFGANPRLLPSTIKIEINSEEYVIEGTAYGTYNMYWGAPLVSDGYGSRKPDFSGEYQFSIGFHAGEGMPEIELYVPTDGDYDVAISEASTIITTTKCFEEAVNSVVNNVFVVTYDGDLGEIDKTFSEIKMAIEANRTVELHDVWGTDYLVAPLVYGGNQNVTFASLTVDMDNASLVYSEYVIDQFDQCTSNYMTYSLNNGE